MRPTRLFAAGLPLALCCLAAACAETPSRDLRAEEANRQLVVGFYERVFNQHDVAGGAKVLADGYRQHNPDLPDGKAPFVSFFTGYFKNNPNSKAVIRRTATDGDLVWLHVHDSNGAQDRGQAVVDIFRVKNGQIVEHWDVLQPIPERSANDNTMF